jgi:hypothetical protein
LRKYQRYITQLLQFEVESVIMRKMQETYLTSDEGVNDVWNKSFVKETHFLINLNITVTKARFHCAFDPMLDL